jgi:hypothetical protein
MRELWTGKRSCTEHWAFRDVVEELLRTHWPELTRILSGIVSSPGNGCRSHDTTLLANATTPAMCRQGELRLCN